jgi:chloramphenicol O-acetyltransferase
MTFIIELLFKNCKHPERYAEWRENIYGDEINYLDCRSLWKAKWWPITLRHNRLYHE